MRLRLLILSTIVPLALIVMVISPLVSTAQRPHKPETPYAATLSGWGAGRHYLYLTHDDVPQGKMNRMPRNIKTEDDARLYFETNRKTVIWAENGENCIVLDTEEVHGYSRVLMIDRPYAGKIGWIARRFVHRSRRTLTGQENTEKANAAQKMVAYDAKDRRFYSVAYAQAHDMHDAGGDLLVIVPMSVLPAEARLSRAMNGKLE